MGYSPEDLFVVGNASSRKKKLLQQLKALQFKAIKNEIKSNVQKHQAKDQLDARKKAMDEFRFSIPHTRKYIRGDLTGLENEYDVFICGSDQIFRPNRLTGELEDHLFLGMVNNGSVKASYAASIGIEAYDEESERRAAEYLSSFSSISMRESSAAEYIKKITGRDDVVTSVDPVFLLDREKWLQLSKPYTIDGQYILVYMIHGTEKLFQSIKEFAKKTGLKIITFPSMSYKLKPYEKNFADIEILDADPLQFIRLLNNAEYIFTDSFHGTAFSLILHKASFVSRANEIAFSRIKNILSMTGAEKMIIPSDGLSIELYEQKPEIDWSAVDSVIKREQDASFEYLKGVIEQ